MTSYTRGSTMTSSDVFSRMSPSVLVDFISDLDYRSPEYYTDTDMMILHQAVTQLIDLVGVSDAIEMLSDAEVCAENPIIDAAFDEVQS